MDKLSLQYNIMKTSDIKDTSISSCLDKLNKAFMPDYSNEHYTKIREKLHIKPCTMCGKYNCVECFN